MTQKMYHAACETIAGEAKMIFGTDNEYILPYIDAEQPFVYNDNVLYYAVICADYAVNRIFGRIRTENCEKRS